MKKHLMDFFHRGLVAAGFGPVVLAIIYGILGRTGVVQTLCVREVTTGFLTVTLMAFIAGGINVVYAIEQLPLMWAILIHAGGLYLDYLMVYLLNSWIPRDLTAIAVFTGIFAAAFALVWFFIYLSIRAKADSINKKLPKTHA